MDYGKLIQKLLDEKNIKQIELSARMNVSPAYLNQLVKGTRKPGKRTILLFIIIFNKWQM